MAKRDYWMDNALAPEDGPKPHTLIDLGYVLSAGTRDRAKQLEAFITKRDLQLVAYLRLLARVPEAKVDAVMAEFPCIRPVSERRGYCWCTHTWFDGDGDDIKHAR